MAASYGKRSLKHKLANALSSTEKPKKARLATAEKENSSVSSKKKPDQKNVQRQESRAKPRINHSKETAGNEQKNSEGKEKKRNASQDDSGLGSSVSSKKKPAPKKQLKKEPTAKRKLNHSVESVKNELINTDEMDISQILALGEGTSTDTFLSLPTTESDSDDEFEEVTETNVLKEPVIPEAGVDITLEAPLLSFKRKKREFDLEGEIRRQLKRRQKQIQELQHKVHLICWIAHLKHVNSILNSEIILTACKTIVTSKNMYPPKHADMSYLERIIEVFRKNVSLKDDEKKTINKDLESQLCFQFQTKTAFSHNDLVYMFVVFLRCVGMQVRLVSNLVTVPLKPTTNESIVKIKKEKKSDEVSPIKKSKIEETVKIKPEIKKTPLKSSIKNNLKSTQIKREKVKASSSKDDESEDEPLSKYFREPKKSKRKELAEKSSKSESKPKKPVTKKKANDSDYDCSPKKVVPAKTKLDRRVLSSDDDEAKVLILKKRGQDIWVEVFLEAEEKWISVDIIKKKIHCVKILCNKATSPVNYVLACNNDSSLKDVTRRYVPNWHSDTRKKRVSETWWDETLWPYLPPQSAREREEDEDIAKQLEDMPLPTSIGEYKFHPLYALKRHLLKFEGIYPPDAPTLGFVRGEPVYGRACVVTLRSREIWFKEARVVRQNETPYKVVKSRPKYDKMSGEFKRDLPLEVFGVWQTDDYIPPTAVGGKVPRNEYGNVDLFKPCMLPGGTVHLQIPALNRVARKLNIDCAPAVVGFDFHSGGSHPVLDGYVVCEEFKDILADAWHVDAEESGRRAEEKRLKRIYGNWRRLIRGLFIRENLKAKYGFGENSDDEESPPTSSNSKKAVKKGGKR